MEELDIEQITRLILDGMENGSSLDFIKKCQESGFLTKEPQPNVGQYDALPSFDQIYQYSFLSPNTINSFLEIIVVKKKLIQIGAHFHYERSFLFNPAKATFNRGNEILESYFGTGYLTKSKNFINYNYGYGELLGYISLIKMNIYGVIFKVAKAEAYH